MEQLVEIWQQASIDVSKMDRGYKPGDLIPQIMQLEKNQQKLLRFKTLGSIILLLAILILFLNRIPLTVFSIGGIGVFIVSFLIILQLINRFRFQITYEERSLTTLQLASVTERKVLKERKAMVFYLPLFFLVALAGINLMYLDLFRELDAATPLIYHALLSGSLSVAFIAGLMVRVRRFRKQFLPLLERIRNFQKEAK